MGAKIIQFHPRHNNQQAATRIIRLSPETDGTQTLYTNERNQGLYFNLPIVAWGLRGDGEIVGMTPWLKHFMDSTRFEDPLNGHWAGYYQPSKDEIFHEAPPQKIAELKACQKSGLCHVVPGQEVTQEIPESHGTHAVMADSNFEHIQLVEIISWQLSDNGAIQGLITDYEKAKHLPVTYGDEALYPANASDDFKYYFHLSLVNKIKDSDPDALSALSLLSEDI